MRAGVSVGAGDSQPLIALEVRPAVSLCWPYQSHLDEA